ncbi:hypothetical protein [Portibacter marinus]|uniref:hypothetical protein n=1 Tax=Portibacter marinus TaxID=2898660 RepID=UPI001F2F2709|nr:hypothetical protein [Portibacter marinus]
MRLYFMVTVITVFIFSCRSEVNELNDPAKVKEDQHEWPKVQEEVDIMTYYDAVLSLNTAIESGDIAVRKDGNWGIIDQDNRLYFDFNYDTIISNSSSVALKKMGEFEIYDPSRNQIATVRSDELRPIMTDFYISKKDNKWALINPNGLMISDHSFTMITGPQNGHYFLGKMDDDWKAYDLAGRSIDSLEKAQEAIRWIMDYNVALRNYGPYKIGMNLDQVQRIATMKLKEMAVQGDCKKYHFGQDFLDIVFVFGDNDSPNPALEKISIHASEVKTKSGIGIGSTKKEVLEAYGDKIKSQVHADKKHMEDLIYTPVDRRDSAYRLIFQMKSGIVESFSLGRLPLIEASEDCP